MKRKKHIDILVREILKYRKMIGIFVFYNSKGKKLIDRYAVLQWLGDSEGDGTITIVSPYLNVLAYYTIKDSIRRDAGISSETYI